MALQSTLPAGPDYFSAMPEELILEVVKHVANTKSKGSLANLASTSRQSYRITIPEMYRNIDTGEWWFRQHKFMSLIRTVVSDPELAKTVRSLALSTFKNFDESISRDENLLCELIEHAVSLGLNIGVPLRPSSLYEDEGLYEIELSFLQELFSFLMLYIFMKTCSNLEHLELGFTNFLGGSWVNPFVQMPTLKSVRKLTLRNVVLDVADKSMTNMLKYLPNATELSLHLDHRHLSDGGSISVWQDRTATFPSITKLSINSQALHLPVLWKLVESFPSVKHFRLRVLPSTPVSQIRPPPQLRRILKLPVLDSALHPWYKQLESLDLVFLEVPAEEGRNKRAIRRLKEWVASDRFTMTAKVIVAVQGRMVTTNEAGVVVAYTIPMVPPEVACEPEEFEHF